MTEDQVSTPKKGGHIVHGVYAKDFLLAWDDREEFAQLHDGLKREFSPNGQSEEEGIFDLAQLYWQKRTLSRLRTSTVLRDHRTQEIRATGKKSWVAIRRALREKAREERKVINSMGESFTSAFSDLSRLAKKIKEERSAEQLENLSKRLAKGLQLIEKDVLPQLRKIRNLPDVEDALDKNYIPDDYEKVLRIEAMIDARITKALARLVAIKEFKRTPAGSPLKQITASRPPGVGG